MNRLQALWIAGGAAFVLLVIYLSVAPDPVRAPTIDHFKTGHIIAYAWCMLWFAEVWRGLGRRLAVAMALIAMGIALEFVQDVLPWHRDFAIADMVDDAIGVAIGFILAYTPAGRVFEKLRAFLRA